MDWKKILCLLGIVCFELPIQAAQVDSKDLSTLVNLMGMMQAKIDRLEKSESALKQSIGALVSTTAQFRVKFDQLENRLKQCESRCEGNIIEKQSTRNNECLTLDKAKRQVPEVVAFSAYLDHVVRNLAKNQGIVYNQVLYNRAGGYDSTTGIFTAPTTGIYLFSWSVMARKLGGEHAYDIWLKLVVNGDHKLAAVAESRNDADDNQGSSTVILEVNQGDKVWLVHYGGTDIFGNDNERTSSFVGVLLYML
ncbi:hypothetical protein ACF0H5_006831 [Mactra antiquata]